MSNASTIKELSEINALAKVLQEKSDHLMKKLGSDKGSSPALKKKGGLSEEDKQRARLRREKIINK